MFGFIPEPLMWLMAGWAAKEHLAPKAQGGQQATQQNMSPTPQVQGGAWSAPPAEDSPYAPGMPVEATPRKPIGPVALDAHISPETEESVWRALQDSNEGKLRDFAIRLSRAHLPAAASIVSYHIHLLAQARSFAAEQKRAAAAETEKRELAPKPPPIVSYAPVKEGEANHAKVPFEGGVSE